MGCSTSKDVESPVKRTKEGWDTVLPKGFAVQVDRSMKSTEAGYIAALFSTNYGNMRNSPVKSDDLSLSKKSSGIFHQSKVSKAVGGDVSGDRIWSDSNHGGSLRKPWSDLRVGVPKLGSESKLVTGATRSRQEQAETINTWELMQGLEDDTESISLNAGKPLLIAPSSRSSAMDKTIQAPVTGDGTPARSMPLSTKLIDLPVSTSSAVPSRATTSISRMAAAPPRPKSFNSIRSIEEVDAHIAARRSRTPPPAWRKKSKKIQAIRQPGDDHLRQTTDVSGPSSSSLDPIISTVSAREEASAIISNEPSDWNPNNLQRALSFKYIFNNDGSEGIDFLQSDTTSTSDYAACLTGSIEYDGPGFRPRPEFSGVASLKDWLPIFGPPNQPDAVQTGVRRSLLGAIEGCSNSAGESSRLQCEVATPSLLNSKRVHSIVKKYGGSNDQLPGHSSSKGPNMLSSDTEGGESPVLDPEVLESFEKASEKLSEKEWYAMTKLESESKSPRDFVHLMRSQRRSSSNSVEGLETPAMGDTTAAILTEKKIVEVSLEDSNFSRPVDGSHSDNHTEERQFSIKQATGESKKVSSERGDEERAVLYSTTWQSNAKAYEDCNAVKTLLLSLGTSFDERNISLHAEYEQELSEELEMPAVVPTLRVKDRCIVGLDSILQLHKKGMLGSLLRREAENLRLKAACLCRGGKFLICPLCKGRRKVGASSCRHCSGTGLIKCPNCSSS